MRWSVDMQQFREVSRTRTIYSTETHTSDFILNTFWNGKPVQFLQERCCMVMTGCQENKSCSKVLNFLNSCIKMGSDESHFNVSLSIRDKVTRQCPQTPTFLKRKEDQSGIDPWPSVYQPNALLLSQTSSGKIQELHQYNILIWW